MTERLHFHFSLSCIGEGNGNPLQCSCLENPRDGGAWWAAVYGVAQSWTRLKWLGSIENLGLPRWLSGKESTFNAGDPGSIPGSGRYPGRENDNPLQYSCLENPMDREVWWATVHGVTKRVRHDLGAKQQYLSANELWELLKFFWRVFPSGGKE